MKMHRYQGAVSSSFRTDHKVPKAKNINFIPKHNSGRVSPQDETSDSDMRAGLLFISIVSATIAHQEEVETTTLPSVQEIYPKEFEEDSNILWPLFFHIKHKRSDACTSIFCKWFFRLFH